MLKKFLKDRRASFAPVFALSIIPLIGATGAAIDYSRAYDQRSIVQDALDAAMLAGGKKIGTSTTAQVTTEVNAFFSANIGTRISPLPTVTTSISGSTITGTTKLTVPTYFIDVVGFDNIIFNLSSTVTSGSERLEVALALDNSGSMSGTKISTLKTAATNLVTTLYNLGATSTKTDPIKVSVVPFAGSVNVGTGNKTASWMDATAVASQHGDTMEAYGASAVNNFTLFTAMSTAWGGCVQARKQPYDADDTAAQIAFPDTMFVPLLAPDEPDNFTCTSTTCSGSSKTAGSNSQVRYNSAPSGTVSYNNYLADYPSACGTTDNKKWTCANGAANCGGTNTGVAETTAFARTCKYTQTPVSITVGGIPGGPNFMCTTPAITALTTTKATVTTAINNLVAKGSTNILEGLAWAWRTLSPAAPFTEGRAYNTEDNLKIIVLMTDGENTYYPQSNFLKSWYAAYGYTVSILFNATATTESTLRTYMNNRTLQACTNAKAAGVIIYTVGFEINSSTVDDPTTALALLKACASSETKYYAADDNSQLLAAFTAIGQDISSLRVSK